MRRLICKSQATVITHKNPLKSDSEVSIVKLFNASQVRCGELSSNWRGAWSHSLVRGLFFSILRKIFVVPFSSKSLRPGNRGCAEESGGKGIDFAKSVNKMLENS
jgi:hypothetical protein